MSSFPDEVSKSENNALFSNVKFCFVECNDGNNHGDVRQVLVDGGAKQISYMSDMVTHVISDSDDNSDVSEAQEIFEIPVVTCLWVIMSVKCDIILPVKGFSPDSKQLFGDVVACPSQLSKKDCVNLWGLFTYYGGKFKLKYDQSCTHLVSSLPKGQKYDNALSAKSKIVTPDWVIDSVKNKSKCDEELYHPRLLILPKSPSPLPPPRPPTVEEPIEQHTTIQTSANQPPTTNISLSNIPQPLHSSSHLSNILINSGDQQNFVPVQRVARPQLIPNQQVIATSGNQQDMRPNVNWMQHGPVPPSSSVPNSPNVRTAMWPQQQVVTRGAVLSQQQLIMQQKWLHQQAANRQGTPVLNQQINLTPQQRLQLQNQQQIRVGQVRPNVGQQMMIPVQHHKPMQVPNNQGNMAMASQIGQIPQGMSQAVPNQMNPQMPVGQQSPVMTTQLQKSPMLVTNMKRPQGVQVQRMAMHQPRQVAVSLQQTPIGDQNLNQHRISLANRAVVPRQQFSGPLTQQQRMMWRQQQPQAQRPPGRVVIQQGVRQIQYEVPAGQNQMIRMQQQQQQQQIMWQRRQMLIANQRQPNSRMVVPIGSQQRLVTPQSIPSHPPPPYPGKATQPPEPIMTSHQPPRAVSPQLQSATPVTQLINSAGQIVTPKTKSALANLLNNRLQTGVVSPNQKDPTDALQPQVSKQVAVQVRKRDTAADATVNIKPTIQLYGHETDVLIPPSSCLIGCHFYIVDYESPTNKIETWKKIIKYHGGEVESQYSSQCTHLICESTKNPVMQQALKEGKRCVTAYWLNDVVIQRKMTPPFKAVHLPSPCLHDTPCRQHMITMSGFEGEERSCLKEMIQVSGAKYTGHMSRLNTILIARRKDGSKYEKAVEWRIPVVNVQWLNDVLFGGYEALKVPGAVKYQNFNLENPLKIDSTNIHHLMFAWRSPIRVSEASLSNCVERSPLRTLNSYNQLMESRIEPPSKRLRLNNEELQILKPKPRVMFSGISDTAEISNIVLRLGGSIATVTRECTHLVVKSIIRSVKMLCCISSCNFVVTLNWLQECNKQNKFIDETPYIPDGSEIEASMGCNLKRTLLRKDRSLIFQNFTFFVTPTVPPSYKVIRLVIESAGGKIASKLPKVPEIQAINKSSVRFIIISADADIYLCQKYLKNGISIYNPEIILTSIMNQHLDLTLFKYKIDNEPAIQRV